MLMGRKPVLALAGAVVTSLALAGGCQSNSGAKPNAWPPPSTAAPIECADARDAMYRRASARCRNS